jgi:hypothetical protein
MGSLSQAPDQTAAEFLTPGGIFALSNLTPFPKGFSGTGYIDVDYASRFKRAYTHPARRFAVHAERKLEIGGAPLIQVSDEDGIQGSNSSPYCPRNSATVPIFAQQAVVLISLVVPVGYVYWLDGYAFDLFPSVTNELNYYWQLRINGQDVLNRGGAGSAAPGRPVHAPQRVTIGRDKATMLRAQEGSLIELVVQALNTIGASDSVSGTIFGTLEGA